MDWRKQKATDLRNNPKVFLPRPRQLQKELEFGTKEIIYNQPIKSYIDSNCNEKGNQKRDILKKTG